MTPEEWDDCTDPQKMLGHIHGRVSDRQLRLFACAVTGLLPPAGEEPERRERDRAVGVAERFADGRADARELAEAFRCSRGDGFWSVAHEDAFTAAEFVTADDLLRGREAEVAGLLRDVIGAPFHPVRVVPSWLTPAVLSIARHIDAEGDFAGMTVLADALEEAGCTDAEILGHLRGPGPHARGCHVLDALLGRQEERRGES